jgi:hypothetical protein
LLFADDLKLWCPVSNVDGADHLQDALDSLDKWSVQWRLPVNREKCSVMSIGSKNPFGAYHIGGYLLKTITTEKDLGVLVAPDFKTASDTLKKVSSATRMFFAIRRSFTRMTPKVFSLLFSSYVRPILEYGLPAIHPLFKYEKDMIERVQRRGSKSVIGLTDLPYEARLERLNLYSMEYRRLRGDLIYVRRILNGEMGEELRQWFTPNTEGATRGHSRKLFKPRRAQLCSDITLSTRAVNSWNSLPESVVTAASEERFKSLLDEHMRTRDACCFRYTGQAPRLGAFVQRPGVSSV